MAAAKETPRQKMIGMIYLVLTALLALNVSSTVLDKFAFINESLQRANAETTARNINTIGRMKESVEDRGNRAEDLRVIADAEALRARTGEVFRTLQDYKETFVEITGGYEEGREGDMRFINGKTDYDEVGHYMISKQEGGEGHGEAMKQELNDYADYVKEILEKNGASKERLEAFYKLAKDAEEDDIYREDENQKGKKFAQLAFENSPTHAALATVSEFQSSMLAFETAALDFLIDRVGLKDLTFDDIRAVVSPQSRYVAAGTKFEADLFIAASASGLNDKIKMTYDGNEVPVSGEGIGKVEFTATPGNYDSEGNARKTFIAEISFPSPGGKDTTLVDTIEYFVVKPVIQIQSQSVNTLYYNCGNVLDVQVPALGNLYNPSFTADGGDAIKGTSRGQVTIVPKARKVVLTVSSNGNRIDSREFGVQSIPAPDIKLYTDAGEVNQKDGISAKTPRLYLRAEPDPSFAQFLPNDAGFRIAEAEITLVSGGLGRGTITVKGQQINLSQIAKNARKGDQISIEIKKVQRQNFRQEVEDFNRFQRFINITLR